MEHLIAWLSSAFLAGFIVSRVGLPPLVGYLLAGYGLSAMGVQADPLLGKLSEYGILLLLFTVGLKLKLSTLVKREVLGVGALHVVAVALISGLIFVIEQLRMSGGLVFGVALAFSSTVLAVKVLEDNGELQTFQGRTVMGILILQDIIAVGLMTLVGAKPPSPYAILLLIVPLLSPLARKFFDLVAPGELQLLSGLLLALLGGELAEYLGVTKELGALLMGVLLVGHPETEDLSKKLWGIKDVLLVAFFLKIGLDGIPTISGWLGALLLMAVLPLQGVLFFGLMLATGLRARTSFFAALALTTYSEFALIVACPLIDKGLIGSEWEAILGVSVAVSLAFGAAINKNPQSIYAPFSNFLERFERPVPHPDQLPINFGHAEWLVVGVGRAGRSAYRALEGHGLHVMGIDADPVRVQQLRLDGFRAVYGDIEDPALWHHASLGKLKGIIVTLPDLRARKRALGSIRSEGFGGIIGTVSFRRSEDAILYRLGADEVYRPLTQAGEQLAERALDLDRRGLRFEGSARSKMMDLDGED